MTSEILKVPQIGCTSCRYCCDGCPSGISIPDVFRTINTLRRYPDDWRSKNFYSGLIRRSGKASDCIACGQCESVCPQHLPILSQMISAVLVLLLLTRTQEVYRFAWRDMYFDPEILLDVFSVAIPAGIQTTLTAFSNVFVQSYINFFGSSCMAGWSCYNKLDQFILLPMHSVAMAATTFVSQNIGARDGRRADRGTRTAVLFAVGVTGMIAAVLYIFTEPAMRLFSKDSSVIEFGVLFLRTNVFFLLFNCVNHVLAGALRGRGDARGPMVIMMACFIGVRQIYLFVVSHFVANIPVLVGFGYPVGWMTCCITEVIYWFVRWRGKIEVKEA